MSFTAILFLAIYFTGLLLTLKNPYYGIATYIFEWHNHPNYQWWGGEVPDLRWSYLIAIVTLISWIMNRKKLDPLHEPDYKPLIWLALFVLNSFVVSTFFAVLPDDSFSNAEELLKIMVFYFLMVQIVRNPKNYRLMIWIFLLGVANFGRIAFEVGSNRNLGVIAPNATEENALSAHVLTALPFFAFYFLRGNKIEKILAVVSIPFALNLIILANSRGTFVGLLVIALLALLWTRGKLRVATVFAIVLGVFLFMRLTNNQFWERQSTLADASEDRGGSDRVFLWRGGFHLMQDYPMGVGGGGFEYYSADYVPELAEKIREQGWGKAVHNTILNVGTEWGFLGLFFFLGFIVHSFLIASNVKRRAKLHPELSHYYFEAIALQLAMMGLLAAGLFHNRQYAEILYWLCAFGVMLRNMQMTELNKIENEAETDLESEVFLPEATAGEIPDFEAAQN